MIRRMIYEATGWTWGTARLDEHEYGEVARAALNALDPKVLDDSAPARDRLDERFERIRIAHNHHNRTRPRSHSLTPASWLIAGLGLSYGTALKALIALRDGEEHPKASKARRARRAREHEYARARKMALTSARELAFVLHWLRIEYPEQAEAAFPRGSEAVVEVLAALPGADKEGIAALEGALTGDSLGARSIRGRVTFRRYLITVTLLVAGAIGLIGFVTGGAAPTIVIAAALLGAAGGYVAMSALHKVRAPTRHEH